MKCSCGAELPDEAIFCKKCGKQIRCLSCKKELSPGAKFCGKCGAPLVQQKVDPVQPGPEKRKDKEPTVDTSTGTGTGSGNKIKPGVIAAVCVVAVAVIILLVSGVFSKKNIIGIWRMNSGGFSYGFTSYDTGAIEFRDNGEYIIYTGSNYTDDYNRGSYTYDNKQITLIVEGAFHFTYNYSLNGNQLSMVSSSGTLNLTKVDLNAAPRAFDDSQVAQRYIDQGYQVQEYNLVSQSSDERIYHTTIAQSYTYMDEVIIREDKYLYSRIGEMWYLNESSDYNVSEDWHILGLWTHENVGYVTTLRFYSFDGSEANIDYYSPPTMAGSGFEYTGTVSVTRVESGKYRFDLGENWTYILIEKDRGVSSGYWSVFTYEGPNS